MNKSTEASKDEMNETSTSESKLSGKAEYIEKLRKKMRYVASYVCTYITI